MEGNANLHTGQKSSNVILTSKCPIKLNHVSVIGKKITVLMELDAIFNIKLIMRTFPSSVMDIDKLSTKTGINELVNLTISSPTPESF